jgi:hypothetical protein
MRKTIFMLCCLMVMQTAVAQDASLSSLNSQRSETTKKGMWVLGAWAAGNIISGAIGSSKAAGEAKYFHQMNMFWGVVNASLAGAGLYSALHGNHQLPFAASLKEQAKLEKLFLFNAGLDVAYMAGGLYLIEKGKNSIKNTFRLKGYGKSILLQGAFLLLFDGAMYAILHQKGKKLYKLAEKIQVTAAPQSAGITVRL